MRKILIYGLLLGNLLYILYHWFSLNPELSILSLGKLSGLLAVFFVLLQVVLIGRAVWVEQVFGLDKLSRVHRLNGYLALFFVVAHPLLIITASSLYTGLNSVQQTKLIWDNAPYTFDAFIGVCLFLLTVGSSIYLVRNKLKYEFWYFVHLFNYLAIFLSFKHQLNGEDLMASPNFTLYWITLYSLVFLNHFLFRFLRQLLLFQKHQFVVDKVIKENSNVLSIYIKGNKLSKFGLKAGQFMSFRFLTKKYFWEQHPFSLSCYPNDQYIRLTPKAVGDFTKDIYASLKPGTKVLIDGPLGTFTKEKAKKDKILLIAGGIGITPIRSMLEEFINLKKDVVLLYAARSEQDLVFKKELEALKKGSGARVEYLINTILTTDLLKKLASDLSDRDTFICGPPPMMDGVIKSLKEIDVPKNQIHFERFAL